MAKREPIYLDEDDYEALHLTALAFGNKIGNGMYGDAGDGGVEIIAPRCIHGHAFVAEMWPNYLNHAPLSERIMAAGLSTTLNDKIVPPGKTLTFVQFVKKANIQVRANATA